MLLLKSLVSISMWNTKWILWTCCMLRCISPWKHCILNDSCLLNSWGRDGQGDQNYGHWIVWQAVGVRNSSRNQQTQKKGRKLLKKPRMAVELLLMRCNTSAVTVHCICLNIMQWFALHTLCIYVVSLPCLMKYIFKLLFSNIHSSVFLLKYSTSHRSMCHRVIKSKARIYEQKF
jgi:hypothetical protein